MKRFILFLVFTFPLLMQAQCTEEIKKIEFNTLSRGGNNQHVVITKDSVEVTLENRRSGEEAKTYKRKLEKEEWTKLMNTLKGIDVAEFSNLESPTKKRTFDGAMHSEIAVTAPDGETYRHLFDNENPHKKLQPLMTIIAEIRQKTIPAEAKE